MITRKSVHSLSAAEKTTFVQALLELKRRGRYDEYVHWHHHVMIPSVLPSEPRDANYRNGAHRGPAFLPWHREFRYRSKPTCGRSTLPPSCRTGTGHVMRNFLIRRRRDLGRRFLGRQWLGVGRMARAGWFVRAQSWRLAGACLSRGRSSRSRAEATVRTDAADLADGRRSKAGDE
jgi:hypothetical protein